MCIGLRRAKGTWILSIDRWKTYFIYAPGTKLNISTNYAHFHPSVLPCYPYHPPERHIHPIEPCAAPVKRGTYSVHALMQMFCSNNENEQKDSKESLRRWWMRRGKNENNPMTRTFFGSCGGARNATEVRDHVFKNTASTTRQRRHRLC